MLQHFEKWIAPIGRMTTVHLYLPDDYEEKVEERYPVVYMFDGQNLFSDSEATFGVSWGLAEFAGKYPKDLIIVGVECDSRGNERLQEYMPYPKEETFFGPAQGRGALLAKWIAEELKPYVDRFWRTWPQRGATAVAGSSMGGLMAMYMIMEYNDLFSKAACLSPSLMLCPDLILETLARAPIDPDTRIYWSFGSRELLARDRIAAQRQLQEYASLLHEKGGRGLIRIVPGGRHNEESWRRESGIYNDFFWFDPSWYKEQDYC